MITPRPYQLDAVEKSRRLIARGAKRILLVLPTGGGKTVIASYIIARALERGSRVLFLAHRRELIFQTVRKLVAMGVAPERVSFLLGQEKLVPLDDGTRRAVLRNPTAPVQVASIDTFRNRVPPPADLVFIDEAHRALSAGYRNAVEAYPGAVVLGLTATPYRADGKGLGDVFQELVAIATPQMLIDEGYLVAPRVFTVPSGSLPDLSKVKTRGGDYAEEQLAEACDRASLVGDIVEHWKKHAGDRRTVAFSVNVEHSKHIVERFVAAGVAAEHLDGMTPADERAAILARLERGDTRVVSNCGVLCEGWDMPSVKVCILARPTKSTGLYLQQAGRILRPHAGETAIILDHAGCAVAHGLPQDEREFSLEAKKKRRRKAADDGPPCKTCEGCFAVVPSSARVCPECGREFPASEAGPPDEVDGQLVEVKPVSLHEKRCWWNELCAQARREGRRSGWASYEYKKRFGVWPPRSFPSPDYDPTRVYTLEEKRAYFDALVREVEAKGYKPKYVAARYHGKFREWPPLEWSLATLPRPELAKPPSMEGALREALDASPPPADEELTEWAV